MNVQARMEERLGSLAGRVEERRMLLDLLDGDGPSVIFVHGIAGVGKTALLRAVARDATARGLRTVRLDARDVEPSEDGLREAFAAAVGDDGAGPAVLVVDTYELLTMLDPWIRRTFVPSLPDDTRVVLAGRAAPSTAWRREYGELLRVLRLENLPAEDAEALLRRAGVAREDARRVNRVVAGHPLALQLAASALRERPGAELEAAVAGRIADEVAWTYLEGLDADTLRALEAASVPRRTTLAVLEAMLPDEPVGDAFARLRALPFVELGRDGLVVHETVREATANRPRALDPARHRRHRIAVWRCLRSELRRATRRELWRCTSDMLFLIEDPMVRESFFPSTPVQHDVTPAEPGELPELLALARDGGEDLGLLRAWWESAPGALAVARDPDGRISGFRTLCDPAEVSTRLLDADPVGRAWREHLRRVPVPRGQRAVFNRHVVRRPCPKGHDAALAALLLENKRVYVEMRPELRRIYSGDIPGIEPYCAMTLGHVPVPNVEGAWFNDLGPASIDGWLADIGTRELLEEPGELDAAGRRLVLDGVAEDLTRLEADLLAYAGALETVRGVGYRLQPFA